jgi:hypothetical protein
VTRHQPIPRNIPPNVGSARGKVGALVQKGASPEIIEAARAELRYARAEAAITGWLTLTLMERARLAARLLAGPDDAAGT